MKHLILLRHGEAGFSDSVDFQRQLTPRGKENLNRLGENLPDYLLKVDFLYCSSATRTRETAVIIKNYIQIGDEQYIKEIYDGNLDTLLNLLENTPSEAESCMIIGHNPTLSVLASHLTHSNYIGLQPGAMAILDLDILEWYMVGLGTGTLKEVMQ